MRTSLLLLVMFAAPAAANAEMWKCTDTDGNTRYTNVKAEAKGCKALNLDPINTTPGPVASVRPPQKAGSKFPTVEPETQRQRDAARRKILEQELAEEQQQLEAAKKQLAEQKTAMAARDARLAEQGTAIAEMRAAVARLAPHALREAKLAVH